jgi:hypothetical protein
LEVDRLKEQVEIQRIYQDDSFIVIYPKGLLKDYEKRVLAGGDLGNLLEMRFISSEKQEKVYYEIAGYKPLDGMVINNLYEVLDIIEGVLTILIKAQNYLIHLGNISLDYRWMYIDSKDKSLRLAYLPRREIPQWQSSLAYLLDDLSVIYDSKEAQPYFEDLKNYMESCQRSLHDLFLKICDLKREAHLSVGPI